MQTKVQQQRRGPDGFFEAGGWGATLAEISDAMNNLISGHGEHRL
jgi:hypothetical protein